MADMADDNLVLKPVLESYLIEAKFPDVFTITFKKAGIARKPDGWFHPSTHPLWTARMLYYYLTAPDEMEVEQLSYESRMAVTMGTAVHGFAEMCVRDSGAMMLLEGTCPACQRPHGTEKGQCDEFGAADPQTASRGHMDGNLRLLLAGTHWKAGIGGLEIKTTNPNAARKIVGHDNEIAVFRDGYPEYYAQIQEYMRISGLSQFVVLFIVLGYPWKLVEFQIPYDVAFATAVANKYIEVLDHVKMGTPPDPCCGPFSTTAKNCPARYVCPIGRMR
jgi:hypothetical protein